MAGNRWSANTILLSVAMVWGLTFVIIQDAIATLPPFAFNGLRFGFAAFLLCAYLQCNPSKPLQFKNIGRQLKYGLILGFLLFAGYALQTYGLLYTSSGKSGFITGLSVALVPFLTFIILGHKPKWQSLFGTALAVAGLYIMAFSDLSSINFGDVLTFICAICFGLQLVYTAKYVSKADTANLVLIQCLTVGILSGISSLLFEPPVSSSVFGSPIVITALLITSLFATVFAFVAQTHYIKYTTPAHVALIFATEPVFAVIGDFAWNGALLGPAAITGSVLILAGMVLAEVPLPRPILAFFTRNKEELAPIPLEDEPPVQK
ncbi:DMT family transporter [Pradoshia sp.]